MSIFIPLSSNSSEYSLVFEHQTCDQKVVWLQVPIGIAVVGEFSFLWSAFCAYSYFSIHSKQHRTTIHMEPTQNTSTDNHHIFTSWLNL